MFKFKQLTLALCLTSALVACDRNATTEQSSQAPTLEDPSYVMGVVFGSSLGNVIQLQKEIIAYDNSKILAGVKDALEGKVDLESEQLQATLKNIQDKLQQAEQQNFTKISEKAKADGDKFRAEFATQDNVKQTESGLLYRIEEAGKGDAIKATDTVTVHYTGKLTDGKIFDSSKERGQPAQFKLNQVIKGWTEGLQLIKKGGKITLVIPPELAYGEQGAGPMITPNATLYFDIEVLDVEQ
ncbi:FKBP-type peptidyl-prolyl cis-trans isomerase [[Haemophilus] felis]|uniref:Peptidyl-prolyl cis-trans isomerase n=1 Tax=[Haemophilus] felis TaxID=123822 RepID=A0A1T0AZV6_9PAST|nr:FKBP-type peptidyl-prolyl cis-trans isomerase [[Haemophilus] felis]NBI41331.1 FKBP-type peptidyl-prolyl cis-trans isomerase [[Haemophilus] felis]OOS03425.1 peptidylprolyl isomerase [[Haemophilus] felis]